MAIIEIKYSLASVNLEREDADWLWKELTSLFQKGQTQSVAGFRGRVTITTGRGLDEMVVGSDDLSQVLGGGLVRELVTRLEFSFDGQYRSPSENRRLSLVLDDEEGVEVRVEGERDWIDRARGRLDIYLKGKANKSKKYRWIAGVSIALLLAAPLSRVLSRYLLQAQGASSSDLISSILPFFLFLMVFGLAASNIVLKIFPSCRLNITSAKPAWYVRWAEEITIAVIAGTLLSVILTLLGIGIP